MERHSRFFIYQTYRVLCDLLGVKAIYYGKLTKKSKEEVIYGDTGIHKLPLAVNVYSHLLQLKIRKNARKDDMQKAIVERILEALEKYDVCVLDNKPYDCPTIEKGTSFEKYIIDMDLKYGT